MAGAKTGRVRTDHVLFNAILILLVVGIVAVYDASYVQIARKAGDGLLYLKKQLLYSGLGMMAMMFAYRFRFWRLKRLAIPMLMLSGVLLLGVYIPHVGVTLNGAHRWIALGPIQFQPSELAKLSLVIYLSALLAKNLEGRGYDIRRFEDGLLAPLIVVGVFAMLIEREPDMGTAIVIFATAVSLFFIAGARMRHIAAILGTGLACFVLLTMLHGFRGGRFTAYLHPADNAQGVGYQPLHSLRAVGSGMLTGIGIGAGREKFYLPEANTDYIFATIAEETGLLGSVAVVGLLFVIAWRAHVIARKARDAFGSMLASGIGAMLSWQAIINVAVATNTIPATGVPLPFISFGGTSLMFTLAGIGILLNIAQYPDGMRIERAVVTDTRGEKAEAVAKEAVSKKAV